MRCALRDAKAALEKTEEEVGKNGEKRGGDGAGKDDGVADHGNPAKNESAEAAGADGGSDGRDADGDDCGGADSREDHGEREGKADAPEDLRVGHAHGFGGFKDGGIDAGEADISVAKNGEKRVQDQGDDGGAASNAADEGNGNKKAEQSEAGNGLQNAGHTEGEGTQGRAVNDKHTKGNADGDGEEHGDENKDQVIESGVQDFGAVVEEEGPSGHEGAPEETMREAAKAWTSG